MAKIVLVAFILLFSISDVCASTVAELLLSTLSDKIDRMDASIIAIKDRLDHIESFIGIHNEQTLDIDKTNAVKIEQNSYSGILQANEEFKRAIFTEKRHIRSLIKAYDDNFNDLKRNISDTISQINTTMLESYEHFEERVTNVTTESKEYIDKKVTEFLLDSVENQNQLESNISSLADLVTTLHDDQLNTNKVLKSQITSSNNQRNSDFSSLNSRISSFSSRHSSDISSLGSRISTEHSQAISSLSRRISSVAGYTDTLAGRISSLHGQKSYFTAQMRSTKSYSRGSTIVFDNDYINYGYAYSRATGKFTAPYTGVYLFSISAQGTGDKVACAQLKKTGYNHVTVFTRDTTGSSTCVTRLNKGEQAWVESYSDCKFFKHRTSFAGVFLY